MVGAVAQQGGGTPTVPGPDRTLPQGVADLIGVLAYGELSAFDRMAADARWAPTLAGRVALAQMAAAEMGHFRVLADHLAGHGLSAEQAMAPFVRPFDAFHDSTAPHSWLESLVKAHVGDGLAADFYREIAEWLDPDSRELVFAVLGDTGHSAFAVREVRRACHDDPRLSGPLALWGRRLLGEALTQAQFVIAERESLAELIVAGSVRSDPGTAAAEQSFAAIRTLLDLAGSPEAAIRDTERLLPQCGAGLARALGG